MAEEKTDVGAKRLTILEAEEIESVYGLPVFDEEERAFYFSLAPPERAALSQLHGMKSTMYFILQLGYFKARRQFFVFNLKQVAADAQYIQRIYFPDVDLEDLDITKVTRLKQQSLILELFQYRVCDGEERERLRTKGPTFGIRVKKTHFFTLLRTLCPVEAVPVSPPCPADTLQIA